MEKSQFKKKEYWYHTANLENTKMQPVRQKRCQKIKKIYMYAEKVSRNREIILQIINIVVVLGQQNIPFHGHTWNKETKSEDGNFTRFLRWKAEGLLLTHILTWRATFALRTIEGSKQHRTSQAHVQKASNRQRILHICTLCMLN